MNIFNELKSRLSIVDIVSEYTTLKRSGNYFKGLCPIHHEKSPSLYVTPHKGIFYCFSCHAGGDGITFVSHMEHCSQWEAARYLADRYQIAIDMASYQQEQQTPSPWSQQQRHTVLCRSIAEFCHKQLVARPDSIAYRYLMARGITPTSIEQFMIGYLPAGEVTRRQLLNSIGQSHYIADDLIAIKFMLQGSRTLYSPFEERIIFPIHDQMGRVTAFGGRIFQSHDKERPKYYNSHESPFFSKSKILYGLDSAKRHINRLPTIYLTEGYLDCIAMHQAGLTTAVATLGTACTAEHIALIAKYTSTITVVYDSDAAGLAATIRLSELCWNQEIDMLVTELPAGEDPASYLADHNHSWDTLQTRDFFDFYINALQKKIGEAAPLTTKLEALRALLERIKQISDPLKQHIIIQKIAKLSSIPAATLAREIGPHTTPTPLRRATPSKTQREINKFAKSLFCAILNQKKIYADDDKRMIAAILPLRLKILFEKFITYQEHNDQYLFSDFFATLTQPEQAYIAQLLVAYEPMTHPSLEMLLQQCRTKAWKLFVQEFQERIAAAQEANDHLLLTSLMQEFNEHKKSILHKGTV